MPKGVQLKWDDSDRRSLAMVVRQYKEGILTSKYKAVNALVAMCGRSYDSCYSMFNRELAKENSKNAKIR